MKFALTFQFIARINSLYEDWSDGGVHAVARNIDINIVEYEDMVVDKLWTFSTLQELKQTELIVFYLQWYMNYITASLSGQPMAAQTNMWSQMLSLYSLMYIYSGSQMAHQSTIYEYNAHLLNKKEVKREDEREKAESYRVLANQLFASFGQCYSMSSQLGYVNAIFSIYSLYASFMYQGYPQQAPVTTPPTTTTPTTTSKP